MLFIQSRYRVLFIGLILTFPINLWATTSALSEHHTEVIKLLQYFKNPSKATYFKSFEIWRDIVKRLEGSLSDAPLAKVNFTTDL